MRKQYFHHVRVSMPGSQTQGRGPAVVPGVNQIGIYSQQRIHPRPISQDGRGQDVHDCPPFNQQPCDRGRCASPMYTRLHRPVQRGAALVVSRMEVCTGIQQGFCRLPVAGAGRPV